jgi:hypothetical protein
MTPVAARLNRDVEKALTARKALTAQAQATLATRGSRTSTTRSSAPRAAARSSPASRRRPSRSAGRSRRSGRSGFSRRRRGTWSCAGSRTSASRPTSCGGRRRRQNTKLSARRGSKRSRRRRRRCRRRGKPRRRPGRASIVTIRRTETERANSHRHRDGLQPPPAMGSPPPETATPTTIGTVRSSSVGPPREEATRGTARGATAAPGREVEAGTLPLPIRVTAPEARRPEDTRATRRAPGRPRRTT